MGGIVQEADLRVVRRMRRLAREIRTQDAR
jgi:hypothetical protein